MWRTQLVHLQMIRLNKLIDVRINRILSIAIVNHRFLLAVNKTSSCQLIIKNCTWRTCSQTIDRFLSTSSIPIIVTWRHKLNKMTCLQASTNTWCNESTPHVVLWQHQWSTGRRWQLHKMDEPEARGHIPFDILRKHFDLASLGSHKTLWQLIEILTMHPQIPMTPRLRMSQFSLSSVGVGLSPAVPWTTPLVTRRSGKVTERKWRCHGLGFFFS